MLSFHISHNGCEPSFIDLTSIKDKLTGLYGLVETNLEFADIIIFLGCTFSAEKESEVVNQIQQFSNYKNKLIVISGCYLEKYFASKNVLYIRPPYVVKNIANHFKLEKKNSNSNRSNIPLVQVSTGCFGQCTFCSIKFVKGRHKSKPIGKIIDEVEFLQKKFKIIKLVGQDIAGYGIDYSYSLKNLLVQIFKHFPNLKIELGSLNPNILKQFSDDDLSVFSHPNIVGNIHIPLQSASNNILKKMKRNYTFEDFMKVYSKIKSNGTINVSTDIIAGFPTENKADHMDNINFIRSTDINFAQIFMYDIRSGTPAAKMPQLPRKVKIKRTTELISEFIISYSRNNKLTPSDLISLSYDMLFNTNINLNKESF